MYKVFKCVFFCDLFGCVVNGKVDYNGLCDWVIKELGFS